jgi:hypothetical protein
MSRKSKVRLLAAGFAFALLAFQLVGMTCSLMVDEDDLRAAGNTDPNAVAAAKFPPEVAYVLKHAERFNEDAPVPDALPDGPAGWWVQAEVDPWHQSVEILEIDLERRTVRHLTWSGKAETAVTDDTTMMGDSIYAIETAEPGRLRVRLTEVRSVAPGGGGVVHLDEDRAFYSILDLFLAVDQHKLTVTPKRVEGTDGFGYDRGQPEVFWWAGAALE